MTQHIKLVKDNFVQEGLPKPMTFGEYIGQERAKNYIIGLIEGAQQIGNPIPPMIVLGAPGRRKTLL